MSLHSKTEKYQLFLSSHNLPFRQEATSHKAGTAFSSLVIQDRCSNAYLNKLFCFSVFFLNNLPSPTFAALLQDITCIHILFLKSNSGVPVIAYDIWIPTYLAHC